MKKSNIIIFLTALLMIGCSVIQVKQYSITKDGVNTAEFSYPEKEVKRFYDELELLENFGQDTVLIITRLPFDGCIDAQDVNIYCRDSSYQYNEVFDGSDSEFYGDIGYKVEYNSSLISDLMKCRYDSISMGIKRIRTSVNFEVLCCYRIVPKNDTLFVEFSRITGNQYYFYDIEKPSIPIMK